MIGWRMVIHACIDGYSRLVIYLHCANNNLAETVEKQFLQGVQTYGLPSRVRTDHGLENIGVAQLHAATQRAKSRKHPDRKIGA